MRYAEIAVTSRTSRATGSFTYSVPTKLAPVVGTLVWVPFGQQLSQGVVVALTDEAPAFPTKDLFALSHPAPVLSPNQIALARWIAIHYCCPLSAAVNQMVPAELRQKATPVYSLAGESPGDLADPRQASLVAALVRGPQTASELQSVAPGKEGTKALRALAQAGLLAQTWAIAPPKARAKTERTVQLTLDLVAVPAAIRALSRAPRQAAALQWLAEHTGDGAPLPLAMIHAGIGANQAALANLARHGYVTLSQRVVKRSPLVAEDLRRVPLPTLTPTQAGALRTIAAAVRETTGRVILLHGVTGSGKGEVYLHALAETLRLGKRAIVLVPEIALTPQTIRRFASRFGGRVAVLHSRLSAGEHHDEWQRIRAGEAAIVIGSRSAVFAPVENLGLIVVDEEHEWSYKQGESDPRYHARDTAIALGEVAGVPVVLGSATPDVCTYFKAKDAKEYTLIELPERVEGGRPGTAARAAPPTIPLPTVQVVDLRTEGEAGNRSIFSRTLRRAIAEALADESQVILYLNRRGTATFVMCRGCGYVAHCRRCDVPLVYHADRNQLLCHHCNRATAMPARCPECWSEQIGFFGLGTQRVEADIKRLFPKARVVRWDRDTARGRAAHTRLLDRFLKGEADIMVGTQMIAKGLDLPQVALVGVIVAETALQLPDFRAAERTFQLLMQVGGRAGRGAKPGRVIIQTYNPQHYGVRAAQKHAYGEFYAREIAFRAEHRYPPFADLARLVYYNSNEPRCRRETERLAAYLEGEIERRGLPDLEVIGPAPAFHRRVRGRFRWHLLLRGENLGALLRQLTLPPGWALDVDPISLL
ncbi:MAG: replication restart helicase PriA [Chloroflexota bacterium]